MKTKPSMQSSENTAKPDQSESESKEQLVVQDVDGVSIIACHNNPRAHVLHVKDKVSAPKGPGRPKKPVDPEKAAKVKYIV